MKYKKINFGPYNLHMIKTNRFKITTIELIFCNEVKKEEITITNFLASAMCYTTKKYNTKIEFAKKLEELYAAKVFPTCYRLGNAYNFDINMSLLNDKYSEKNLLEKGLDFLKEIVFNPNIIDNCYDEKTFKVIKNEEKSQIERVKEDPRRYSLLKLLENVNKDEKYAYIADGYIEDLEKITRENLCDFHKKLINESIIDIFIVGDIDFRKVQKIVKEKFNFIGTREVNFDPFIKEKKHNKKINELYEKDNTNQAKLSIACTMENLTKYERFSVLNLYNLILGGTADSKFFKNIREKYSLCYYVSSVGNKLDNLLLITSGITKENYKKMMTLIKKEMDDMRKGNFTEEELEKAKKYYLTILEEIDDKPNQIIASFYAMDKINTDSIEERKKKTAKVTKEEIMALANKIHLDTSFLLGGDKK